MTEQKLFPINIHIVAGLPTFFDIHRRHRMASLRFLQLSSIVLLLALFTPLTALADSKAEARRYFSRGITALKSGQTLEGIQLLQSAYNTLPHPDVLFNIGRAYASLGQYTEAIEYLTRYSEEAPGGGSRRVDDVLKELRVRKALKQLADDGMRNIREGRFAEGIALLKQAYKARPHPNVLYNIALGYDDLGDKKEAIATYTRYLGTQPKDTLAVRRRIQELRVAQQREERSQKRLAQRTSDQTSAKPRPRQVRSDRRQTEPSPQKRLDSAAPPEPPSIATAPPPPQSDAEIKEPSDEPSTAISSNSNAPSVLALSEDYVPTVDQSRINNLEETQNATDTYEQVVITASKRVQKPLTAPNAVTIISAEDIRLSGVQFLPDLLRRVPGFEVLTLSATDYSVGVRGFTNRLSNNVLILVDNQSIYNDAIGATFWSAIPVELADIERIEVVRGPGSAVFGANAYTGVVNIITKRPQDVDGAEAGFRAGNGNAYAGHAQFGRRTGSVGLRVSAGYRQLDKFEVDFDSTDPAVGTPRDDQTTSLSMVRANALVEYYPNPREDTRVYLSGSFIEGEHETFGAGAILNQYSSGPEFRVYGGVDSSTFVLRTLFAHSEKGTLDQSFSIGSGFTQSVANVDVFSVEPIFTPSFTLLGKHQVVLGAEYRFKAARWELLSDNQTENHFAAYFQDDWSLTSFLTLVVGGRLDAHPNAGLLGSPRVAIILNTGKRQALRLSAGTAFRAPNMGESYFDYRIPVNGSPGAILAFQGNTDLSPEQILTVELGYRLESDFGNFEAVTWVNQLTNPIVASALEPNFVSPGPTGDTFLLGISQIANSDAEFLAAGGELSTRLFPVDGLDVGASYAFQYIIDQNTNDRFRRSPLHKASLWSQLRTGFGIDASLTGTFISKTDWNELVPSLSGGGVARQAFSVDDAFSAQGRVGYRAFDDRLELSITGINIFDIGNLRRQEHPFGNFIDARILLGVTGRL